MKALELSPRGLRYEWWCEWCRVWAGSPWLGVFVHPDMGEVSCLRCPRCVGMLGLKEKEE